MAFELPTELTQMLTPQESAKPMPQVSPAGFEKAGSSILASGLQPAISALPEPPPGYRPGPLAPIRHEYEDSTLYKIGSVLSSFGEQVPTNIKIRMAQQESDLKLQENKLAWDNYYKNNEIVRELSKKQNREASEQFVKLLPGMKAEITSMFGMPEEDQLKFVNHFAKIADSLQPGGGEFLRFYHKNQSAVTLGDDILSSPDKSISGPAQEQVARMGYFNWLQTEEHKHLSNQLGYDYVTNQTLTFPKPMKDKLVAETMTEAEYKKLLKETAFANGMRPVSVQGMMSFLDTPAGQNQMVHMGVQTDAMAAKKEGKEKAVDPIGADKLAQYEKDKNLIEFAEANPGVIQPQVLAEAKHRRAQDLGHASKDASPQANPGGDKAIRMQVLSHGMYSTVEAATSEQDPSKQAQAYKWAAQAVEESDRARPLASQDVTLAGPGDTAEYIDLDILKKTGRASGIKGEVSKRELLTNKRYGKTTPDQKKQLSELNIAEQSASDIFDLAIKGIQGNFGEAAADRILSAPETVFNAEAKAAAKKMYPDLSNYVPRREATLGKFARSISGEVGVLTDQDVVRVRNLFAIGGETVALQKAKRKALNQLIALNRKFAVDVIAGEMLPEDLDALRKSDKYKSAVNGIFGSVEGLSKQENVVPQYANPAEDKPKTGVNKLMQDLEAGK